MIYAARASKTSISVPLGRSALGSGTVVRRGKISATYVPCSPMASKRRTWTIAPRGGTKVNQYLFWKGNKEGSRNLGERRQSFPSTPPKDKYASSSLSFFDDNAEDEGRDDGDCLVESHRPPRISLRDIFEDTTKVVVAGAADASHPVATQIPQQSVLHPSMKVANQLRAWKGRGGRDLGERRQSFPSTPDKAKDARSATLLFDGNVDGRDDGDCRFQNHQLRPRISFRDIFKSTMDDGDSQKASYATTQDGDAGETRLWIWYLVGLAILLRVLLLYGPKNQIQQYKIIVLQ